MDLDAWIVAERLMQWLVLPLLAGWWALNARVGDHAQSIKVLTALMEERRSQREEDRAALRVVVADLKRTLDKLDDRLETFVNARPQ